MPRMWPYKRQHPHDAAAIQDAKETLAKARADEVKVADTVGRTRRRLEENHLALTFDQAMGGPPC